MIGAFKPLLRVGPRTVGGEIKGFEQSLFWDGKEAGIVLGKALGQEVTSEVTPKELLRDVDALLEQVCLGELDQVEYDEEFHSELRKAVANG